MYKVDHGQLPAGYEWACLGEQSHYPATSTYAESQYNTSSNNLWSEPLADALRPYTSGSLPNPIFEDRKANSSGVARGLIYGSQSSHVGWNATITYYLQGEKACPIGQLREYRDSRRITVCNLVIPYN